jgi:hypothetical protein
MNSGADTKVEKLRSWLKALNHDDCNLKVERCPQGTSGSGYGAVAGPCGVAKGSVVVRVPKKALMTEDVRIETKSSAPYKYTHLLRLIFDFKGVEIDISL